MSIKLFDIRINLSFLSVLLLSYGIIMSACGQSIILMSLISALIHELGHFYSISIFKGKPTSLEIKFFEVKINCNDNNYSYIEDVIITSSGIAVNFIFALILRIVNIPLDLTLIDEFCACNLFIGLINLVPLDSFDGGQLLSLLLSRFMTARKVSIITGIITIIVIFPLMILGVYILFVSKYNFSVLYIALYLIVISFLKYF